MGADTKIEWADDTFNPWVGCTKLSAACDHCYAESWAKRAGEPELWQGERRLTSRANWHLPRKWNREAAAARVRKRVFCASLADVFDNRAPDEWRRWLWELIDECQALDWLLLTKRPQNIAEMLPVNWDGGWPNVWLGTTVENQKEADRRIPHLLAVPARVRFLSCEPLLGPLDLYNGDPDPRLGGHKATHTFLGQWWEAGDGPKAPPRQGVDWVICGGESGAGARPMHPDWARSLRDQCAVANVPFFFKQWGEFVEIDGPRCRSVRQDRGPGDFWLFNDGQIRPYKPGGGLIEPSAYFVSLMRRVGKNRAGRLLDGVEHNEIPEESIDA